MSKKADAELAAELETEMINKGAAVRVEFDRSTFKINGEEIPQVLDLSYRDSGGIDAGILTITVAGLEPQSYFAYPHFNLPAVGIFINWQCFDGYEVVVERIDDKITRYTCKYVGGDR